MLYNEKEIKCIVVYFSHTFTPYQSKKVYNSLIKSLIDIKGKLKEIYFSRPN